MDARKDDDEASLAVPLASSSTSSCSCGHCDGGEDEAEVFVEQSRPTEEKEEEDKDERGRDGGGGDREVGSGCHDNGYLTPTSPEHIISPIKECPPAPKKTSRLLNLSVKGRVGGGRSSRSTLRPVRVLDLSLELGEFVQQNKRARMDASIAE